MNPCRVLSLYTFGGSGFPIPKSVLGYFIKSVAMAFLVSSPTKFENSASGMCLVVDTKYTSRLCACKLKIEFYLSPISYLQLSIALVSNKKYLQQLMRLTNIMHLLPRHIPHAYLQI